MATYQVSLKGLLPLIKKHSVERTKRVQKALSKTARRGVTVVKKNVPVAFGELRETVHAETISDGASIVIDAPHAAAIELGSRPHWVPLDALVKWVKLRALQGLSSPRQQARLPGRNTAKVARHIAERVSQHTVAYGDSFGATGGNHLGDAVAVDAPLQIARAIQFAIAAHGTKPHFYARDSVDAIYAILDEEIKTALEDQD